ncbi:hypothetical protein [Paludisphaera mucosa]|uniref:Uncharacterized protein n=1 Tax=Paludisphaera mucosa TaxID=3030827 RepID=A0ABT6FKX9_9BACT|nr:hypothetical protein [Paludisphaera mucosa]MDG3008050.1 hypothetical protein [Paludisphaera mucosa]
MPLIAISIVLIGMVNSFFVQLGYALPLMAALCVLAGLANVFLTSWVIALDRAVIPAMIAARLEAVGFLSPRTVRIAGYIATSIGAAMALCLILRVI